MSGAISAEFTTVFSMIAESIRRHGKSKGIRFLIDATQKRFESVVVEDSFPFEEIGHAVVKIKWVPLRFQ